VRRRRGDARRHEPREGADGDEIERAPGHLVVTLAPWQAPRRARP
jgi:hypothetical protein